MGRHGVIERHAPCACGCTIRGGHQDACGEPTCGGCRPARAVDGLLVCSVCERKARDGLRDAPGLYADLGDPRTSTRPRTGSSGSDSGSPMLLSPERITARDNLRRFLTTWCMILEDDYALTMPAHTIRAMAHHIAVQAGRILADPDHAEQLVAEMWGHTDSDGNRYEGRIAHAWRLARPGNRGGVTVACPSCGNRVRLRPDADQDVTCTECGEHGDIRWWRTQLAPKVDQPMCSSELLAWLAEHHRITTTEVNLRVMANRGQITRAGRDDLGRTLWDPVEVAAVLIERRVRTA